MALTESISRSAPGILRSDDHASQKGEMSHRYETLFAPVADEMQAVEGILQKELVSRYDGVNTLLQQGVRLSGKRLRPALLLLTASACGKINQAHLLLAAVLEMIHTATLVHDDVLDEATLRRHHATVNALAGNEASVLLGDFLFSHSFFLASTLENTFACQRIGRTTNRVCEGEMRQIYSRGNYDLTEAEYLQIIEAKTAQLCACCCELGAHYAGADVRRQRLCFDYGRNLGIAFQIFDDVLDLVGDQDRTGKSLGTDLDQEKLTLPFIRLLATSNATRRAEIIARMHRPAPESRRELTDLLQSSGSLKYARHTAGRYAETAQELLGGLPASPAQQALRHLASFVVARHH